MKRVYALVAMLIACVVFPLVAIAQANVTYVVKRDGPAAVFSGDLLCSGLPDADEVREEGELVAVEGGIEYHLGEATLTDSTEGGSLRIGLGPYLSCGPDKDGNRILVTMPL